MYADIRSLDVKTTAWATSAGGCRLSESLFGQRGRPSLCAVSIQTVEVMKLVVAAEGQPPASFAWRIWSNGTSFYLKSTAPGMKRLKLSLHGDDPRHPSGGGFKLGFDSSANSVPGETAEVIQGAWPIWFPGRRMVGGPDSNVLHVARFRWTWDACTRLPPAGDPGKVRAKERAGRLPFPPEPGDAIDVDLVLSDVGPHWPREKVSRPRNACLGPLRNDADQWLTGVVAKRRAFMYPPPPTMDGSPRSPVPTSSSDAVRGIEARVDPDGVMWIIETRMSLSWLGRKTQDPSCVGVLGLDNRVGP